LLSRNSSANKSTCLLDALENGKREFEEDMSILIISGIEGVRNCAEAFSKQLEMKVEVAEGRRAALAALRHREFVAVVVDESLAECDPAAADAIWERSGLAIPLQINFAVSGAARIIREIRAALHRREREQAMALEAATASIEKELKNTVSGLLLQSQLALSQGGVPAVVAEKLRMVADLAGTLRQQLSASSPPADISARSANH
jgi:DNA-binding NtrC family response regulator